MVLKVCMFVHNDFRHDSRVLKEAKTLAEAGHDVRVIAVLDNVTEPYEERDGFRVVRVVKDPVHYRLLRAVKESHLVIFPRFIGKLIVQVLRPPFRRILKTLLTYFARAKYGQTKSKSKLQIYRRIVDRVCQVFRGIGQSMEQRLRVLLMVFHRALSFWDYYRRSFRLVIKERADIYHANDLNTLPVAYWAKKKTGGKLIYDSHELYLERNTERKQSKVAKLLLSRLEYFLVRSVDDVITVSESIGQELKRRYPIKRLSVILNTPCSQASGRTLSLRDELRIPKDNKIILYVGNITFNRGLEELIQSVSYLDDCVVVIMGRAPKPAYNLVLRRLAREAGVESKVYYFGPVPAEDVTEYAAFAHVGAASIKDVCLSYYYCLPNKLFEYMAAGLPVAGSNFPELKKVIEGYNIGKTFNPDDPKDIAEAINYVLSDKQRYMQMKRNALRAARVFSWENESKKLLKIYKRLEDELNITPN